MIETKNRKYNFVATINLKRGENLGYNKPADDVVKWLHIELENKHTVFYEIIEPDKAQYNVEFRAKIAMLEEDIINELRLNKEYNLYRGPEKIGTLRVEEIIKNE